MLQFNLEKPIIPTMTERDTGVEEKRRFFPSLLDSAYDLASGGMGIHLNAVDVFAAGRELTDWVGNSVRQFDSNYLVSPYVIGWTGRRDACCKRSGPHATTPRNEDHLRLIVETSAEYDRLDRATLRVVLAGEEATSLGDIEAPLTDPEEFRELLVRATGRGLIQYDPTSSPEVEIADDEFGLARSLISTGIRYSDHLWTMFATAWFSDMFKMKTLQVAIHKLGCMLALTDQLTFDAQALGVPISRAYKPAEAAGEREKHWQRLFGKPMPGLEGLYQEAHAVLITKSDPQDPLIAYLYPLRELPQLVA